MAYTPLPTPPQRNQPATFADDGDAFLAALPQFGTDMEAVRLAAEDAIAAVPVVLAAEQAANAAAQFQGEYAAGTTYQIGQSVSYGGHTWFAKTINIGVTPATGANWQQVVAIPSPTGHAGKVLMTNGETTSWAPYQAAPMRRRAFFSASGSHIIPVGVTIRGYAFGAGAAGTTTQSGAGGGCAYGDIAVAAGDTVTVTIAGGIATITTASIDRLTGSPASGITAGTASKHVSVTNGGAYSGGAGGGVNFGGASSGSPLGAGVAGAYGGGAGWGGAGTGGGGGGAGGPAGNSNSGSGFPQHSVITEPILIGLTAPGEPAQPSTALYANNGGPGAGGGTYSASSKISGAGGFGGGGGNTTTATSTGGAGGTGGGGGSGNSGATNANGGPGGFGGGGGYGQGLGGAGGGAAVFIYY